MTNHDDAAMLIRCVISKEADSPREYAGRLGEERTYALLSAALAVAAQLRFPAGTTVTEISDYAEHLADRFPDASDALKPAVVEAVIRAARGERDELADFGSEDVVPLLYLLTRVLATENPLSDDGKETFVDETLSLADMR